MKPINTRPRTLFQLALPLGLYAASAGAAPPGVVFSPRALFCSDNPTARACDPAGVRPVTEADGRIVAVEDGEDSDVLWLKRPNYAAVLDQKRAAYAARVEALHGRELDDGLRNWDRVLSANETVEPKPAGMLIQPLACGIPMTDTTPDGQGNCKLVFGNDSRTIVPDARTTYPATKFATMTVDRYLNDSVQAGTCSGTFLDEDHVITAAHCVYDTTNDNWVYANPGNNAVRPAGISTPLGTDHGRGYVCRSGWMVDGVEFEDHCEFIKARWTMSSYVNAAAPNTLGAIEYDVAILELERDNHPAGLGDGAWVAMSSINSTALLESKVAVSHGYPAVHPPGLSWNMDERAFNVTGAYGGIVQTLGWEVWGARQYTTWGGVEAVTTPAILRTKLEASGGQSGSGIFYYTDDAHEYTGQAHYLIGVLDAMEADFSGNTSNDHVIGATVGQFRDFANTIL